MVLILSSRTDQATNRVIDWMTYYGIEYYRTSGLVSSLEVSLQSDGEVKIELQDEGGGAVIDLKNISSFWYRRSDWSIFKPILPKRLKEVTYLVLDKEWDIIREFIHHFFERKPCLGSIYDDKNHNKLLALATAASVGLSIPETLITTEKAKLTSFFEKVNFLITKAVYNMFRIETKNRYQTIGTQRVKEEEISLLGEIIFPVLVQKEVEKEFELRVFFLNDTFYPMAIFSQQNEKTQVDFRNYDRQKPNRNIPFNLPNLIEGKLREFVEKMNLRSGSIDMIVTPENEFVFLEVNPIGQFGWVSLNCNYFLEEKVAFFFKETHDK